MLDTPAIDTWEELDHRSGDGVDVYLLWNRSTDDLSVRVLDAHSGDAFALKVEPKAALDVFNHPYAHAAHRGVAYDSPAHVTVPA